MDRRDEEKENEWKDHAELEAKAEAQGKGDPQLPHSSNEQGMGGGLMTLNDFQ